MIEKLRRRLKIHMLFWNLHPKRLVLFGRDFEAQSRDIRKDT